MAIYQVEVSKSYTQRVEVEPNRYAPRHFRDIAVPTLGFADSFDATGLTTAALQNKVKAALAAFIDANAKEVIEVEL